MEIVLIKLRTLKWPAVVVERDDSVVKVRMNSYDTEKLVKESVIEMFDMEKIKATWTQWKAKTLARM